MKRREAYGRGSVGVRRVRNGVRVRLEGKNLDKVDEEVLSGLPAVRRAPRQLDRNAYGIVGERFDMTLGNVETVASDQKAETHGDRDAVDSERVPQVFPGGEELEEKGRKGSAREM
jgi:hypothetical protein